ncbi:MAG: DNA-binding response regulator [Chloroflexi bacterium]|nr:MAG: DNA-binding response regulator [Chloroflexota bacterium]HDN79396.1 response regulator transcription factor [Chloroflexota bacterium]
MKIKVMLVDDHPFYRQGLRYVIEAEEDMEVVAEAGDGKEALKLAKQYKPSVAIVDINLPSLDGLQVTRALKVINPDTGVIVITAFDAEDQLFHALRAGAAAYFYKDVSPEEMVRAIRMVAQGHYVIGDKVMGKPEVASWLLKQFERLAAELGGESDSLFKPLSPREMEILHYVARGYSNKEISYTLKISEQTVKNHLSSILRKLAVNDRTQAVLYAIRRGWIRLEDIRGR